MWGEEGGQKASQPQPRWFRDLLIFNYLDFFIFLFFNFSISLINVSGAGLRTTKSDILLSCFEGGEGSSSRWEGDITHLLRHPSLFIGWIHNPSDIN